MIFTAKRIQKYFKHFKNSFRVMKQIFIRFLPAHLCYNSVTLNILILTLKLVLFLFLRLIKKKTYSNLSIIYAHCVHIKIA